MKNKSIFLVAIMMIALASISNGQRTTHKYIDKIKEHKKAYAFTFPGWLVRTGLNVAFEDEIKEAKGYQDIVKGIKQLRFVVVDEGKVMDIDQFKTMVSSIQTKDKMEEYARIKEDDQHVVVLVKESAERISNLLVLTYTEDEFAMVNVKSDISLATLQAADFTFNEHQTTK